MTTIPRFFVEIRRSFENFFTENDYLYAFRISISRLRRLRRQKLRVPSTKKIFRRASRVMPGSLSSTHCKKFWRDDEDEVERLGDTARMMAPFVS